MVANINDVFEPREPSSAVRMFSPKERKELFNRAKWEITEEYRIREEKSFETYNSIMWRMHTPSLGKLQTLLVYDKNNDTFNIIQEDNMLMSKSINL